MSVLTSKWFLFTVAFLAILGLLFVLGQKSVHTKISISAPKEKVWSILTDTAHYEYWNPVFSVVNGQLTEGGTVTYHFTQNETTSYDIETKVKRVIKEDLLHQRGGTIGILTFDHRYTLEKNGEGTTVFIDEVYKGIAVPFWNPKPVEKACQTLGLALKARAEEDMPNE